MDIYAVAKAAQIGVGAINVWQQRGLIPGIVSRGAGRQRLFDVDTATFIGIMAALSRQGIGPTPAAGIAAQCGKEERYRLVMLQLPAAIRNALDNALDEETRELLRQVPATVGFNSLGELEPYFETMFHGLGPPDVFTVINVGAIRATMQAIEDKRDEPTGALTPDKR